MQQVARADVPASQDAQLALPAAPAASSVDAHLALSAAPAASSVGAHLVISAAPAASSEGSQLALSAAPAAKRSLQRNVTDASVQSEGEPENPIEQIIQNTVKASCSAVAMPRSEGVVHRDDWHPSLQRLPQ